MPTTAKSSDALRTWSRPSDNRLSGMERTVCRTQQAIRIYEHTPWLAIALQKPTAGISTK